VWHFNVKFLREILSLDGRQQSVWSRRLNFQAVHVALR